MIIGIGTDIIEIQRVESACKRTLSFQGKVFTEVEIDYFQEKGERYESLAGMFAAKEAVSKALGTGFRGFSLKDIEVSHDPLGRPIINLYGKAKGLANSLGIRNIHLSISHCKAYATAYVVAEGGTEHEINVTGANEGN